MSERDDQREQRRANKKAATSPDSYELEDAPIRLKPDCNPPDEPPVQQFFDPVGCPVPDPDPDEIPDPLVFDNAQVTKTCADLGGGDVGSDVIVEAGSFRQFVYFQTLPDITVTHLTLIAGLSANVITVVKDPGTTVSELRQLLQLEVIQAQALSDAMVAARAGVAADAEALALGSLVCVWVNTEQTIECPPGAIITGNAPADQEALVNNPLVIAAGEIESTISQADADAQALAQISSQLLCLWGNNAVSADCVANLGFTEVVPVDGALVGEAPRLRVGSFTVAANTIFSDVSQADADALALQQAIGSLDCFYINTAQNATCPPDVDGIPATVEPAPSGADASAGESGNPVTVPVGFIESDVSTADANDQARELATSSLNCYWLNDPQVGGCPIVVVDGVEYAPAGNSPISTTLVAAGLVVSFVSKAAANAEAILQAELSLDCRYCNKQVDPLCLPSDFIVVDLPVPISAVDDTWSLDATLGAPAGLFCAPDPVDAQNIADSIANVPIPPVAPPLDCTYGNDPIEAQCAGNPLDTTIVHQPTNPRARGGPCFGGTAGTGTDRYIVPQYLPADGTVRLALFDETLDGPYLSSQSFPNPWNEDPEQRKVKIAQNTFTATAGLIPLDYAPGDPNRAKLYANELAASMAIGSLNCFFSNCAAWYRCDGQINQNIYDPPLIERVLDIPVYGQGSMFPSEGTGGPYTVAEKSYGSVSRPLFVGEGQFVSYVSRYEVEAALNAFVRGSLNCFWDNAEWQAQCGAVLQLFDNFQFSYSPGGVLLPPVDSASRGYTPIVAQAELFQSSVHPNIPEIQAISLITGQLDCFWGNDAQYASCPVNDYRPYIPNNPATHNASVPARLYFSSVSKAEANQVALIAARGQLSCLWDSERVYISGSSGSKGGGKPVSFSCPAGKSRSGPNALAQGSAQSTRSTSAATEQAKKMLAGMQSCDGGAPPGNDGAQTNCEGPCYGYFS